MGFGMKLTTVAKFKRRHVVEHCSRLYTASAAKMRVNSGRDAPLQLGPRTIWPRLPACRTSPDCTTRIRRSCDAEPLRLEFGPSTRRSWTYLQRSTPAFEPGHPVPCASANAARSASQCIDFRAESTLEHLMPTPTNLFREFSLYLADPKSMAMCSVAGSQDLGVSSQSEPVSPFFVGWRRQEFMTECRMAGPRGHEPNIGPGVSGRLAASLVASATAQCARHRNAW